MLRLVLTLTGFLFFVSTANATNICNKQEFDPSQFVCQPGSTVTNAGGTTVNPEKLVERSDYKLTRKKCEEAIKEVKKSTERESDFRKACKKVTQATDAKTCIQAANKCELCVGTSVDEESDASCQDGDSDDDSSDDNEGVNGLSEIIAAARRGQKAKKGTIIDKRKVRRMQQRFNNCPIYSKDEFDKIVEAREKHEEGKKEGQKLLEDKLAELKTAERELSDLQKEQAKIPTEYQEEFDKITGEQTQKLQDQLKQTGDQMVELILNIQTAEMQFTDAKNAIYKLCFDKAQAALDRVKDERSRKIRAGELRSKGGFAGLAKQTSTETRLERYAQKIQNRCKRKNSEVRNQIKSAETVFELTLKRLNLQLDKLEAQQQDIANKLLDTVEDPEEKARLDALLKSFQERSEAVDKQIAEKMEQITNLQTVLARIQDELQENETLYAHYLDQEKQIARRGDPDDKAQSRDDFLTQIEVYEGALDQAYKHCDCQGDLIDPAGDTSECANIKKNMDRYFGDGETGGSGIKRVREGADK